MGQNYSIFLSTCDAYKDCWDPFFLLFKKYWPDYSGTIYMVTDNLTYQYEGLKIKCLNINTINGIDPSVNISWGKRMRMAMDLIDDDIILFMQEDFFIKDRVKNDIINNFAQLMVDHKDLMCLHLTRPQIKDADKSEFEHLYNMKVKQRYRADCQPALWRKEELYNVLEDEYSPWQMEVFGSKKSAQMNHRYLIVDKNWVKKDVFEIIPYVATGISKAKWEKEVVPVFNANGIVMDYSIRGFYERGSIFTRIIRAIEWRFELYKRTYLQKLGLGKSSF